MWSPMIPRVQQPSLLPSTSQGTHLHQILHSGSLPHPFSSHIYQTFDQVPLLPMDTPYSAELVASRQITLLTSTQQCTSAPKATVSLTTCSKSRAIRLWPCSRSQRPTPAKRSTTCPTSTRIHILSISYSAYPSPTPTSSTTSAHPHPVSPRAEHGFP
jgi:hypothetical protein